ncbi:uncharacterized protein LOC120005337 [Tripterygium wilfordii]|uniref:uncharacterized protein LOC120005337 n=1 Tax=Tripterygium wilfordii TaxID=458696 RepID=UPI0018F84055|nr:uncharacterized protein LOC120005337 [Tripterygium wilfordii]
MKQQKEMDQGNHARGSVLPLMAQEKPKSTTGLRLRWRPNKRSLEAKVLEKLRAKVSKKRAETERKKEQLNQMEAKLEEMNSEHAGMLDDNRLTFEENVHIQLYVDYMLFAFLYG